MKTYIITKDNKEIKVKEYEDGRTYRYDSNDNEVYYKSFDGDEEWFEYDENNNLIHYKSSDGYEEWFEYDENNNENNNEIHYKNTNGLEYWKEYDENNNLIHYKNSNGNEDFYINNKKVTKEEWLNHNTNFQYKYLYDVILTLKEWNEDITLENIKNNLHNIKINNIEAKFVIVNNMF